jgi:hypothetical protein
MKKKIINLKNLSFSSIGNNAIRIKGGGVICNSGQSEGTIVSPSILDESGMFCAAACQNSIFCHRHLVNNGGIL